MRLSSKLHRLLLFAVPSAGVVILLSVLGASPFPLPEVRASEPGSTNSETAALKAEIVRLKSIATDQSHVMADVGYHFANLWFAGANKNWPLAKFYFDETGSHLNWAVRVIPVRKDTAGNDVDLKSILQAVDSTLFTEIGKAIETKDKEKFSAAYKGALQGCYACHKASGKPYLRPQIPTAPPQPIINFDPDASWPE